MGFNCGVNLRVLAYPLMKIIDYTISGRLSHSTIAELLVKFANSLLSVKGMKLQISNLIRRPRLYVIWTNQEKMH